MCFLIVEIDLYKVLVTPKNARWSGSESRQHLFMQTELDEFERETRKFQGPFLLPQYQFLVVQVCSFIQHKASKHKPPSLSDAQVNIR